MREHLYRSKRADNGEWVYGFYFEIHIDNVVMYCIHSIDNPCIEIIPETICEYIGLTDKNGNKIFDGDILKSDVSRNTCGASPKPIYIHFADGAFCWAENKNDERDALALCDSEHFRDLKLYEVIGNIYDNPELTDGKL